MNRLPELRESLLDAARREHERVAVLTDRTPAADPPSATALPGTLPLGPTASPGTRPLRPTAPARRASHSRRPGRASAGGRHASLIGAAVAGLLVVAAAGFAGTRLIGTGSPVRPPAGFSPTPRAGSGVLAAGSARLLPIATPDPAGGPAWGMRVLSTTRGLGCVQVGRLLDGQIGAVGQDGAFADDGLFHPLPSTAISTGTTCELLDGAGQTFIAGVDEAVAASGVVQDCRESHVQLPAEIPPSVRARIRRLEQATPVCPAQDLRTIYYGLLGPQAQSVTYRSNTGRVITTSTVGRQGAYLLVFSDTGSRRPSANSHFSFATGPGSGILSVQYGDGHQCVIRRPDRLGGARPCPPVGEVPVQAAAISASQVATPIHVSITTTPAGSRVVHLSFVARVAVRNSRSNYDALIVLPRNHGCAGRTVGGGTFADADAGQRVTQEIPISPGCHGLVTGRVTYVRTTGLNNLQPPVAPGPVVGRFAVTVP